MNKKSNVPLLVDPVERRSDLAEAPRKKPSIETARARLGGRAIVEDAPPIGLAPGVVVTFPSSGGRRLPGVIVFASRDEAHVLLDGLRLRRLAPNDLVVHDGDVGAELEKLSGDARLFGLLVEGQPVRYVDESGDLIDGKVVEKCRWGALILRGDGAVIAVGFRKLWPAPTGSAA